MERNTLTSLMAILLTGITEFITPLKYFFLIATITILVDLRFGIAAAKKKGIEVRTSRAIRRTINKFFDYICWILVAGALGAAFEKSFEITFLPAIVMIIVIGIEINSIFDNYFIARGIKLHVNIFKLFTARLSGAIDDNPETNDQHSQTSDQYSENSEQ